MAVVTTTSQQIIDRAVEAWGKDLKGAVANADDLSKALGVLAKEKPAARIELENAQRAIQELVKTGGADTYFAGLATRLQKQRDLVGQTKQAAFSGDAALKAGEALVGRAYSTSEAVVSRLLGDGFPVNFGAERLPPGRHGDVDIDVEALRRYMMKREPTKTAAERDRALVESLRTRLLQLINDRKADGSKDPVVIMDHGGLVAPLLRDLPKSDRGRVQLAGMPVNFDGELPTRFPVVNVATSSAKQEVPGRFPMVNVAASSAKDSEVRHLKALTQDIADAVIDDLRAKLGNDNLQGVSVAVTGAGRIGTDVASRLRREGAKVTVYDGGRQIDGLESARSLDEAVRKTDVVIDCSGRPDEIASKVEGKPFVNAIGVGQRLVEERAKALAEISAMLLLQGATAHATGQGSATGSRDLRADVSAELHDELMRVIRNMRA